MYVLHSFANAAVMSLGMEQFLGLYLCAGVVSSLGSYMFKTAIGTAGLSLGAVSSKYCFDYYLCDLCYLQSGAIMGVLAYVCSRYPDTQLSILFLPMITFSAGTVSCKFPKKKFDTTMTIFF